MKIQSRKLGFIVNPIAGMGGRVGLKGTDGEEILRRAIGLGAEPVAPSRAREALEALREVRDSIQLITYPHEMGEDEAGKCGFNPKVVGSITSGRTTAMDTKKAVEEMMNLKVNLILFVGGDGTARDICEAAVRNAPVLGVPAGVKIHSAAFAVGPQAAARIAIRFLWGQLPLREVEVMDVDEEAFREGRISARLYGYVLAPYEPSLIQGSKMASPTTEDEVRNQAAIAIYIHEMMRPDTVYVLGPGTTTRIVVDLLDGRKTLLGVDLLFNKKVIAKDLNEEQILEALEGKKSRIIVTPIGGQGFIFGRGNQQISPAVIRKVGTGNITVIATRNKLRGLKSLRVDTGDSALDDVLRGRIRVVVDYREERLVRVE
jgi:predicted polyphosphate/ATP-dependent NAD kinase